MSGGSGVDHKKIAKLIAEKSCLACSNFGTKKGLSICKITGKTVFKDSGCDSWGNFHNK